MNKYQIAKERIEKAYVRTGLGRTPALVTPKGMYNRGLRDALELIKDLL